MTEISDDKTNERKIRIIIHKRQNKNIKVCRQSRADLNNTKFVYRLTSVHHSTIIQIFCISSCYFDKGEYMDYTIKRPFLCENFLGNKNKNNKQFSILNCFKSIAGQ